MRSAAMLEGSRANACDSEGEETLLDLMNPSCGPVLPEIPEACLELYVEGGG